MVTLRTPRKYSRLYLPLVLVAGVAALYDGFFFEPTWIEITRPTISLPVKTKMKIMLLSDLHVRALGKREELVLKIVQDEKPDLIAITGDYVSDSEDLDAPRNMLAKLRAPKGVWVVRGNWEHWGTGEAARRVQDLPNIHFLNNSNAMADDGLWIVGLDDKRGGDPQPAEAFKNLPPDGARILLFHSPAEFDEVEERFDLALAGHTHGGQIRFPFLPPLWLPNGSGRFLQGWYESLNQPQTKLYVSRGVGTSAIHARFFCRPEVAVITITPRA